MSTNEDLPQTFAEFGLRPALLQGIEAAGFAMPSPIQQRAIPVIMQGRDVIAQAQTGTGKTAAFGLPAMHRLQKTGEVELLVIVPTRELASQVSDELYRLGRFADIRTVAVYGGQSISRQVKFINRGAQVVTATPGRLLDHLRSGRLEKFNPSIVVLDEADEMLDMGFLEDIEAIFEYLPAERQTLLFSATVPPPIRNLAQKILQNPVTINVTPKELATPADISQRYYVIEEREREEALVRLIDTEAPSKALIFCRTKAETDALSTTLISRGYSAKALHGDMEQAQRNEAIDAFKKGRIDLLIATDVAARGLDITDVSHVFNYHIPFDPDSYIHRIGRTGRAGKTGIAITLVTPLEFKDLTRIMRVSGAPLVYEPVPTAHEARRRYQNALLDRLQQQPIHEEAVELLQRLREESNITEVACKALSLLLGEQPVAGPNIIGLSRKQVERMMELQRFGRQRGKDRERGRDRGQGKRSERPSKGKGERRYQQNRPGKRPKRGG